MVATTIKGAASALASAFQDRIKRSPLHIEDSKKALLITKTTLPSLRETPPLFKHVRRVSGQQSVEDDHAVDLVVGSFFLRHASL